MIFTRAFPRSLLGTGTVTGTGTLEGFGLQPSTMGAREFERYMRDEIDRWGKVVKTTGVKSE